MSSSAPPSSLTYPLAITLAGAGRRGFIDGPLLSAYLDGPLEIVHLSGSQFLVVDGRNNCLRVLDSRAGTLGTLPSHAAFLTPRAPTLLDGGRVACIDSGHNKVRLLTLTRRADGTVSGVTESVLAGCGRAGAADGSAESASFSSPAGMCALADGSLLVADTGNHAIRRLAPREGGGQERPRGSCRP